MEKRTFGRSGVKVPVVGMGTWRTFDVHEAEEEEERRQIVMEALSNGANFFDSSPMYGEAERVLGSCLGQKRNDAFIATKVWAASTAKGLTQIHRALDFFQGRVELYQIHNLVSWREHLSTLEQLKDEGKIDFIGATHYSPWAFEELAEVMNTGRIDAVQIPYNPLEWDVEENILPVAEKLDLGVIVMRPFAEGDLVKRSPEASLLRRYEKFNVKTWPQILLKWVLSESRVHVAIPATSRVGRMTENAAAGEPPWFTEKERHEIVQIVKKLCSS